MRRARQRYGDLAEIAADEAAVRSTGGPGPLAAAMLRFDQHGTAGAVGVAPERVDHLLGGHPRWELSTALLAGAILSILGILTLAYAAAATTPSAGLSLSMPSMQVCGVAMVAVSALAAMWILSTARRVRPR